MFFRKEGAMLYLELDYSHLYAKIVYQSPADTILNRVIEYDLKGAGFNAIKENKLMHPDIIERLDALEKEERNVAIGLMIRRDPKLGKKIQRTIKEARRLFFEANKIRDEDIVSIKNDAVFIIGRKLKNLDFNNMKFVEKNTYTSFHLFDRIEMYYNHFDERIDIKGINDKILESHEKYMLSFLATCFSYIELGNIKKLKKYLIDFSISYKSRKLHPGFYRELSSKNYYRYTEKVMVGEREMIMVIKSAGVDDLKDLDISYNYLMYVLPLINRYL